MNTLRTTTTITLLSSLLLLPACPSDPGTDDDAGTTSTTGTTGTDDATGTMDETVGTSGTTTDSADAPTDTTTVTTDGMIMDLPIGEACDIIGQDCPEGLKCSFVFGFDFDNVCVPVQGSQMPGEPCTGDSMGNDDCDAQGQCWNIEDGVGTCTPYCTGTPENPMCPDGYGCNISSSTALCIAKCDPIEQDCAEGQGCYWANNDFACIPNAGNPPGQTNEPCSYVNDCAPGHACLIPDVFNDCAGMDGCCGAFCDVGLGDGPCQAVEPNHVCWPFFEQGTAPPGYENVGVCILPQ